MRSGAKEKEVYLCACVQEEMATGVVMVVVMVSGSMDPRYCKYNGLLSVPADVRRKLFVAM